MKTRKANETFAFPCGVCGGGSKSEPGLAWHAYHYHRGIPRSEWQPGWERKKRESRNTVADAKTGEPIPIAAAVSRSKYGEIVAERNRPRGAAEDFIGLPWPKMPSSAESCDGVAHALGKLASSLDAGSEAYDVIMSQRDYYLALGARKRKLALVS